MKCVSECIDVAAQRCTGFAESTNFVDVTTSQKRRARHLRVCRLLKVSFAVFTNRSIQQQQNPLTQHIHNTQQQPKWATFALLLAALPSHSMDMSAAPPMHSAAAPYGPTQGARDQVWPRHGRFLCWGGKMKTQQKIEREWWLGLRWPKLYGKMQQPTESWRSWWGVLGEEPRLGWSVGGDVVPSFGAMIGTTTKKREEMGSWPWVA